jgi:hypothetical protein
MQRRGGWDTPLGGGPSLFGPAQVPPCALGMYTSHVHIVGGNVPDLL